MKQVQYADEYGLSSAFRFFQLLFLFHHDVNEK